MARHAPAHVQAVDISHGYDIISKMDCFYDLTTGRTNGGK